MTPASSSSWGGSSGRGCALIGRGSSHFSRGGYQSGRGSSQASRGEDYVDSPSLESVPVVSEFAEIRAHQFDDAPLCKIRDKVLSGEAKENVLDDEGALKIKGRVWVPRMGGLIRLILEEANSSKYSIYPGMIKMYRALRQHYWWGRLKRDIIDFVARCLNFQQFEYKHQKPGGVLQRMPIPE
ncbi:uncharacterized protein LOC132613513 [Lycium barbarum]|uniref:uncharacterized protein LOC132613513 n=1 Tax=Lycium barbarum TaxID=112863 RepID=UPI00293E1AFA|nr:uncharacterized protein LOC132613513 [Lycium barbarum]